MQWAPPGRGPEEGLDCGQMTLPVSAQATKQPSSWGHWKPELSPTAWPMSVQVSDQRGALLISLFPRCPPLPSYLAFLSLV